MPAHARTPTVVLVALMQPVQLVHQPCMPPYMSSADAYRLHGMTPAAGACGRRGAACLYASSRNSRVPRLSGSSGPGNSSEANQQQVQAEQLSMCAGTEQRCWLAAVGCMQMPTAL